jgi:hypothetical protein
MPRWQRLVIALATTQFASFVAALLWRGILGADLPGYFSSIIDGITTVPVWESLKLVGLRPWA